MKPKETDLKRLEMFWVFFILANNSIRNHLEQTDVVLVVRSKLKATLNKIVMPRHVGRRYGLAFVILPIRF